MWYFLPLIGVMETANGGRHKAMPPPGRAQALGAGTCECAPSLPHPIEPRPAGARGRAGLATRPEPGPGARPARRQTALPAPELANKA